MSVLRSRLVRGDSLPMVAYLTSTERAIGLGLANDYMIPVVDGLRTRPARPATYDNPEEWEEVFDHARVAPFRVADFHDFEVPRAVKERLMTGKEVLLGGRALHKVFKLCMAFGKTAKTLSHLTAFLSALETNAATNAVAAQLDPQSFDISRPANYLAEKHYALLSVMMRLRRLAARMSSRHEMRGDGLNVLGLQVPGCAWLYGGHLTVIMCERWTAVLTQGEVSHLARTLGAATLSMLASLMVGAEDYELGESMKEGLRLVLRAWDKLGDIAPAVLHKAKGRAVAGQNDLADCAVAQDADNQQSFEAAYGDLAPLAISVYNEYVQFVEGCFQLHGATDGLTAAEFYRLLPEAPGDHAQTMTSYRDKGVDFDEDDESYERAVKEVALELDALALTALARRRTGVVPEILTYEAWQRRVAGTGLTEHVASEEDFLRRANTARGRMLRMGTRGALSMIQGTFLDTNGIMELTDWVPSVRTRAKDKALMPNDLWRYLKGDKPIRLSEKNKLAHVYLNPYSREDWEGLISDHTSVLRLGSDVKGEQKRKWDAKRLFYVTQIGAWVAAGQTEESVGQNMAPLGGYAIGQSQEKQEQDFKRFISFNGYVPWYFCTDCAGWSINMRSSVNQTKARRYGKYLASSTSAGLGELLDSAEVYGRDKFGTYGPLSYGSDLEGLFGKANTGWHMGVMRRSIPRLRRYLQDELGVWGNSARFSCFIDDGILRANLTRRLTGQESLQAFNILCDAYAEVHHVIDRTKAYYGHNAAVFLDKTAVNGVMVNNWTKVIGKILEPTDIPLASMDLRIAAPYSSARGMVESGAPVWIAAGMASVLALLEVEYFTNSGVQYLDGARMCIPLSLGGYGGARWSSLKSSAVSDSVPEGLSVLRCLARRPFDATNKAFVVCQIFAKMVLDVRVLRRSTRAVLRNPAAVSLEMPTINTNRVSSAVEAVLPRVCFDYDADEHQAALLALDSMDVTTIQGIELMMGVDELSLVKRYDALVAKVRRARFLIKLLDRSTRVRLSNAHKDDILRMRSWPYVHYVVPLTIPFQDLLPDPTKIYAFHVAVPN